MTTAFGLFLEEQKFQQLSTKVNSCDNGSNQIHLQSLIEQKKRESRTIMYFEEKNTLSNGVNIN